MNQSLWSNGMHSSSSICLDNCTVEHLPTDASGGSVASYKEREGVKMLPDRQIYSSADTASGLTSSNLTSLNSSKESSAGNLQRRRHTSTAPYGHHDWNLNTGHQAKRARVENIIKGMTCTDLATNQHKEIDYMLEDQKHVERCGSESTSYTHGTRKQLERQPQHFRAFSHADGGNDGTNSSKEEKYPGWSSSETPPGDDFTDACSEFERSLDRKYQGWKKVKLLNYFQSKPERIRLMADVLKCELSRAVSRSIDSIFRSMPLSQTPCEAETTQLHLSEPIESKLRFSCCGSADTDIPDVQTEALSLVVQKPELERSRLTPTHHPKSPIPFGHSSALHENHTLERNFSADQHALRCLRDGCSEAGQTKFDTHWNSTQVKSKVNSRSPQTLSMDPLLLEGLRLPHVKIESDGLVKSNLYVLNEGLTTNHLKKAKLMFFYTRYPSSLVLRMCFHDVQLTYQPCRPQFTRCITSQLIKWFSNFREFYYIQMEKFARSALMEGVVDVRKLTVGRESELFRALNMHYNKANDYQAPERFREVAELTLREFYIAISTGKDQDPSWKKAIYKVICKLDSDVPSEFKIHHSA